MRRRSAKDTAVKYYNAYHALVGLMVLVFVTLQTVSISHATEYGDASHEHDSIVCVMDSIATEQQNVEPPVEFATPFLQTSVTPYSETWLSADRSTALIRGPPPRAPPAFPY